MKSKLLNEDELLLRYILNELDPSEERLVEQAMLEDENVLIEVESLRTTFKKLQNLPLLEPPADLIPALIAKAGEVQLERSKIRPLHFIRKFSYAAAATILIGGGSVWYVQSNTSTSVAASEEIELRNITSEQYSSPWVDKRNILRVGAAGSDKEIVPDSVMNKLRPIDGDLPASQAPRQLHLTGSQK